MSEKYYGKYRGTVVNNIDPQQMGRIQVLVPDVTGFFPTSWAMPCTPIAGIQTGWFALPAIGSGVWVEFEQGDPDYPIWVGGFWGSPVEVPLKAFITPPEVPAITIQTPLQNAVIVSDMPGPTGGIVLTSGLASITINELGIVIQNGQGASIVMGPGPTITINEGALVVI